MLWVRYYERLGIFICPGGCHKGTNSYIVDFNPLLMHLSFNVALAVQVLLFLWGKVLQTDFILLGIVQRSKVEAVKLQKSPGSLMFLLALLISAFVPLWSRSEEDSSSFRSSMPTVFLANDSSTASRTPSSS